MEHTKFKKFKISDPFLQLITVKYEKQIPWQVKVFNEKTLNNFISEVMLPQLISKTIWDSNSEVSKKSLFIHYSSINIEMFLENDVLTYKEKLEVKNNLEKINSYDQLYNTGEINSTFEEFKDECRKSSAIFIANIFNERKAKSFFEWIKLLNKKFKKNIGFQYLILKPLLEQSGYNSRRSISEPDENILKWLFVKIENNFYQPSVNIMFEYRIRLISGLKGRVKKGWQFIPSGTSNTKKLTAAAYSSGWCIEDSYMANYYLQNCYFYILNINESPVVAIRVNSVNNQIKEIRGQYNSVPINYSSEIWFFINVIFPEFKSVEAMEMIRSDYNLNKFYTNTNQLIIENENNVKWWQRKLDLWPGTYHFIPNEMKLKCKIDKDEYMSNIFYLGLGTKFWSELGVEFLEEDFISILLQYPQLYQILNDKNNINYKTACVNGVVNRLNIDDISFKEFNDLPDFVKNSKEVIEFLQIKIPKNFLLDTTKRATNRTERASGTILDNVPFNSNEQIELTITRTLEYIIKNDSSDFSDIIFPPEIRMHEKFSFIREEAWLRAVHKNPTFYFAFPVDLIEKKIWKPQIEVNEKNKEMLKKWVKIVEAHPWYLETEKKVPKAVRYHEYLLRAYVKGWSEILEVTPYYMWKKVNLYQRVYMSYAAFRNFYIFKAIAKSPQFHRDGNVYYRASLRMFQIPAFQLAMLYASIIYNVPKYFLEKFMHPLHPTAKMKDGDPQRKLISLYNRTKPSKFINIIELKTKEPENYYFNRINPKLPYTGL